MRGASITEIVLTLENRIRNLEAALKDRTRDV
jgi:hypothetical protein